MPKKSKTPFDMPKTQSPLKAIRKFCMQCGDGTSKDIESCPIRRCPLHPYRFAVMPSTYLNKKIAPGRGLVPKR